MAIYKPKTLEIVQRHHLTTLALTKNIYPILVRAYINSLLNLNGNNCVTSVTPIVSDSKKVTGEVIVLPCTSILLLHMQFKQTTLIRKDGGCRIIVMDSWCGKMKVQFSIYRGVHVPYEACYRFSNVILHNTLSR